MMELPRDHFATRPPTLACLGEEYIVPSIKPADVGTVAHFPREHDRDILLIYPDSNIDPFCSMHEIAQHLQGHLVHLNDFEHVSG